jgi:hypothetical protein
LSRKVRTVIAGLAIAAAAFVAGAVAVASTSANAATTVTARYSPLGATANGVSGPATAEFDVAPFCCPSDALELTPRTVIPDTDSQWVVLGLPWDNPNVTSVRVCYAVRTSAPGTTYISQTRLSTMTTPNSAGVVLDNGTNRTSTTATCYTVKVSFTPTGTLNLELRVVFGSTADRITIGMVALTGTV